MSRSFKHQPIAGCWLRHTEKDWKTNRNRRLRHLTRLDVMAGRETRVPRDLNGLDGFRPKDIDGYGTDRRGKGWYGWDPADWPNERFLNK